MITAVKRSPGWRRKTPAALIIKLRTVEMTTRMQREHLKGFKQIDALIDDAFVAETWSRARPKQPLLDFPQHLRSSVRTYLEWASIPSAGEMGLELRRLHDRLIIAIELRDCESAARALEQTPKDVLS